MENATCQLVNIWVSKVRVVSFFRLVDEPSAVLSVPRMCLPSGSPPKECHIEEATINQLQRYRSLTHLWEGQWHIVHVQILELNTIHEQPQTHSVTWHRRRLKLAVKWTCFVARLQNQIRIDLMHVSVVAFRFLTGYNDVTVFCLTLLEIGEIGPCTVALSSFLAALISIFCFYFGRLSWMLFELFKHVPRQRSRATTSRQIQWILEVFFMPACLTCATTCFFPHM